MARRLLITGGAGFIGVNAARHFIRKGETVTLLDNFSRRGTRITVDGLGRELPDGFRVVEADIRHDLDVLDREVAQHDVVLHLAAQVAVTTSVTDPRTDFECNALGSFNVLEAVRRSDNRPFFLNASRNKVYGTLEGLPVREEGKRFRFVSEEHDALGVPESQPLDFHSPYGVSKGVADQYTIDYCRIYGLKTVTLRQSCIYGPNQFGVEDQGWLAWFTIAAMTDRPITIYGTGKQMRDALYVDDLVRLYDVAIDNQEVVSGKCYNVGGGPSRTLSLAELLDHLKEKMGYSPELQFTDIRPGDQPVFVADIRRAKEDLGWEPQVSVEAGIEQMHRWLSDNEDDVRRV